MFKYIVVFAPWIFLIGCKDQPYQERVIARSVAESPAVEIISPVNNAYLSQKRISINGSVAKPELVKSLQVKYRGISEHNKDISGIEDISIKKGNQNWQIDIGNGLVDGEYSLVMSLRDIYDKEQHLPEVKITIDQQAPEILGALDGIAQAPYLQETINYVQNFLDGQDTPGYAIEAIDEPEPLDYRNVPTIYRWVTRINDEKTAPSYTVKLTDGNEEIRVSYGLGYECKTFEDAPEEALKKEDGTYEIKITQSADFDLSHDSEENAHGKSYCLNIWAVDRAGNLSNHKVEFIWKVIVPQLAVEIISPVNNAYLSQKRISINGSVSKPELVKTMQVKYRGISESNKDISGTQDIGIKKEKQSWQIDIGNDLVDGEYSLVVSLQDIYGKEQHLPEVKITIDQEAPEILGALDGIAQAPYLQETIHYRQKFLDEKDNPRYEIEAIDESGPLDYRSLPTIYRWLTRINDEKTAPSYTIKLTDGNENIRVSYGLSYACKAFEYAAKEALKKEDGTYEIKIMQNVADFDLSHDSEENARGKSFCLSIWAADQAGNRSNHKVEFIWKVIVPPLSLDMNVERYKASRREDDLAWIGPPVWKLFRNNSNNNPIALKKDLVIGHVIMSNPFSSSLSSRLELKKGMQLKLNRRLYQIPANTIDIKYFAYDLTKNEVGPEMSLNDGSVIINAHKTMIAKFILARELPITGVKNPGDRFWRSFSLEIGFVEAGNDRPVVDGLTLITRDSGTGTLSSEFVVPWGSDHAVRRRVASRSAR